MRNHALTKALFVSALVLFSSIFATVREVCPFGEF